MKRSIINSKKVKNVVHKVVDSALEECAFQHKANGEPSFGTDQKMHEPPASLKQLAETQPVKLKITFEYYWEGSERSKLFCQPVIDLVKDVQ